jgi:hypothetical protein
MTKRLLLPRSQVVGLDGRPLAGAKLYTYATGTATPKPVWTDAALTVAHLNPVVADAAGRFPAMFLAVGDYRTILTDAADVTISTDDPVEGQVEATVPPWTDVASAATTDLGFVNSENLRITGTTTITSFGTSVSGTRRQLRFAGALVLTHNATSLILPGGADITTGAGDTAVAISLGAGNWVVVDYQRAEAAPLPAGSFLRNRLINGAMAVDQRNAGVAQTFTAGAALAYSVDRWYGYSTGANVTGQRVAGAVANTFRYQFTGAASVTAIGFGQRMEALNTADLAGQTCTLSVDLANSLLTTVTWTAFYANTTDTFGTLASPTRTQIATGTFTVTGTVTRYSTPISVPAAATTGIEIVFTVGAQTSGTWTIGNVQLEVGSAATSFERMQFGQVLMLCQRYYEVGYNIWSGYCNGSSTYNLNTGYKVTKRALATVSFSGISNSGFPNSAPTVAQNQVDSFRTDLASNSVSTAGFYQFNFAASAEL